MRVILAAFLLLFAGAATSLSAQQSGRRCAIRLVNVDRKGVKDSIFGANVAYDAGGNVRMRCLNDSIFFGGDSLHAINAEALYFYTKAYYRDPDYTITADTLSYSKQTEFFKAIGHVVMHDLKNGSSLTGPYLEYKREAKGIRDSSEVLALNRSVVQYYTLSVAERGPDDHPYTIVANVLHGFGQSRLRAIGDALIDRDSLHAHGDSIAFVRGKSAVARVWGNPGIIRRATKDSFFVLGKLVIVHLVDDKIRDVHSFGQAHVTNGGSQVVADSIAMAFASEKLSLTTAWDKTGASVRNAGYFVRGDSVVIETPEELLRELRAFGHAMVQNPPDSGRPVLGPKRTLEDTVESVIPDKDTMTGYRIVADFGQVDSAGTKLSRLKEVESIGAKDERATSFTARMVTKDGTTSPSVTRLRADTILVQMKQGDSSGVASVFGHGHFDALQLETASKPKSAADSIKAALPVKHP